MNARRAGGLLATAVASLAVALFAAGPAASYLTPVEPPKGGAKPSVTFLLAGGSNPARGDTFMVRFGRPKGSGQAADDCRVIERRGPRSFKAVPDGLWGNGPVEMAIGGRRRPKIVVRRWEVDPNLTPGVESERIAVRGPYAIRFEGKPSQWRATLPVPPDRTSFLVVRLAWPDPDDCAAGPDLMATGLALKPPGQTG